MGNSLQQEFAKVDLAFLKYNKKHVNRFFTVYNVSEYVNILSKDKKNTDNECINCILPFSLGKIKKVSVKKTYLRKILDEIVREIHDNSI